MSRSDRLELRLTPEERASYEWAAQLEGLESVAAWVRQNANKRVRQLQQEAAKIAADSRSLTTTLPKESQS